MMRYKGYLGVAEVDPEAGVLRGRVVNTRDTITFQGGTVPELDRAFRDSVDDYLEFCASRGEAPERPASGQFLVRIRPEVHRTLAAYAAARGVSLNTFITRLLRRQAARIEGGIRLASGPAASTAIRAGGGKLGRAAREVAKKTKGAAKAGKAPTRTER